MTKEELSELYSKYIEADDNYRKYMDQFFTITINGQVLHQATKGMSLAEEPKISELEKEVKQASEILDKALKEFHVQSKSN